MLLICRQHPLVLLHPFLISALILLIPLVVNIFAAPGILLSLSIILALVLGILHAALAWYAWHNTLFLLTNERVVFLNQKSFVHREFSECTLNSIQQVMHEVKGLRRTLFGYGTILIYTGGSQAPLNIADIPDPYEIQQEILRAASKEDYQ